MYHAIVSQCVQTLKLALGWLDKAEKHAATLQFDVDVLAASRLAPDMAPLSYQVTSACDYVKAAAARLAGQTPPRHDDTETTIRQLRDRIERTIAFAESVLPELYEGARERKITVPWAPGRVLRGEDYLKQIIVPNTYFHLTMIYAILRNNGVRIGKQDFLGKIDFIDA